MSNQAEWEDPRRLTSGLMNGTTPPCEMTTSPRSLFNLSNPQSVSRADGGRKACEYSLLVVPDCELQMTGHNTLLLVVARCVARKLEDLSSKILKYRREVYYTQVELNATHRKV